MPAGPAELVQALVSEIGDDYADLRTMAAWQAIGAADDPTRKAVVSALVRHIRRRIAGTSYDYDVPVSQCSAAIGHLCPEPALHERATPLAFSEHELAALCEQTAAALDEARVPAWVYPTDRWVLAAGRIGVSRPRLRSALAELARALHRNAHDRDTYAAHRGLIEMIEQLLGEAGLIEPDAWQRALRADEEVLSTALVALARGAPAKPTARFAKQHAAIVARFGREACRARVLALLRAVTAARAAQHEPPVIPPATVPQLLGFVAVASLFDEDEMASAIADLGIEAYREMPHFGPRSGRLGTACARALAVRPDALAHLARMHQRTAHPASKKKLETLLGDVAAGLGVSPAELVEIVVPDHGLRDGRLTRSIGPTAFELAIDGDSVAARWVSREGGVSKAAPAALRVSHRRGVDAAKATKKEVRNALGVQRARLEGLLREDREWPFEAWQVRYLEHGLIGTIARRLVWRVADDGGERSAIWHHGWLLGIDGRPLPELGRSGRVRLWHPVGEAPGVAETLAALLADRDIDQPFSQVRRATFAPEAEDLRSGAVARFAGIRVRQHQLAAILQGRGWSYRLRSAAWDGDDCPTLELPAWGLSAVLELAPHELDEPSSDRSIYLETTLQTVSFHAGGRPVSPADVPLVAFSETLRDVGLVAAGAQAAA